MSFFLHLMEGILYCLQRQFRIILSIKLNYCPKVSTPLLLLAGLCLDTRSKMEMSCMLLTSPSSAY